MLQTLADVDFVIEAVRESEDIKRSIFARLDKASIAASSSLQFVKALFCIEMCCSALRYDALQCMQH